MSEEKYREYEKLLITGIVFSLVTIIGGEMPLGWIVYPENMDSMTALIIGSGSLSVTKMACGVLFGGIGIPLQYFGYRAVSGIIGTTGNEKYVKFINAGTTAVAFGGGTVHILCVALMYIASVIDYEIYSWLPPEVIEFTVFIVLPFSCVFMLVYIPMNIAMFIPVIKGDTILPKWACVFNPMVYKILLNIFALFAPNRPWANAVRMSNMGIGSLITFAGILSIMKNHCSGNEI